MLFNIYYRVTIGNAVFPSDFNKQFNKYFLIANEWTSVEVGELRYKIFLPYYVTSSCVPDKDGCLLRDFILVVIANLIYVNEWLKFYRGRTQVNRLESLHLNVKCLNVYLLRIVTDYQIIYLI